MVGRAARELEMDRIVLRRRNVVATDRFPYRTPLGFTYDSGNYDRALDRAYALLEHDRWRGVQTAARREGRLGGVGMALYVERAGSAVGESAAVWRPPGGRGGGGVGATADGAGHAPTFGQGG